jgi:hypothetical protein
MMELLRMTGQFFTGRGPALLVPLLPGNMLTVMIASTQTTARYSHRERAFFVL